MNECIDEWSNELINWETYEKCFYECLYQMHEWTNEQTNKWNDWICGKMNEGMKIQDPIAPVEKDDIRLLFCWDSTMREISTF